jgi:hypothetical protein
MAKPAGYNTTEDALTEANDHLYDEDGSGDQLQLHVVLNI